MSQGEFNPYEVSSDTGRDRRSTRDEQVEVSALTIQHLSGTRPWVGFLGILTLIGAVLAGLGTIGMIVMAIMSGEPGAFIFVAIYVFITAIYGAFASYMRGYARQIRTLETSESVEDLELALDLQRKFWKLAGLITAITLVIYLGAIILAFAGVGLLGFMLNQQ